MFPSWVAARLLPRWIQDDLHPLHFSTQGKFKSPSTLTSTNLIRKSIFNRSLIVGDLQRVLNVPVEVSRVTPTNRSWILSFEVCLTFLESGNVYFFHFLIFRNKEKFDITHRSPNNQNKSLKITKQSFFVMIYNHHGWSSACMQNQLRELLYKVILLMRGKSDDCCLPTSLFHSWKSELEPKGRDARRQLDQWDCSDAGPSIPHVPASQWAAGDAGPSIPHMCRAANQGVRGVVVTAWSKVCGITPFGKPGHGELLKQILPREY